MDKKEEFKTKKEVREFLSVELIQKKMENTIIENEEWTSKMVTH